MAYNIAWPDRPVRLVLATRLVALVGAPMTLLLVATYLSPAEQGLYFVFVNVQALSQLFELGAGSLIVQFASHEFPRLYWEPNGSISGDADAQRRVSVVLRQGTRWYGVAALILAAISLPVGLALFTARAAPGVPGFAFPWIVTVIATALYLILIPTITTIEGSGRLVDVQRMRLTQAAVSVLGAWTLVPAFGGLPAVATIAVLQLAIAVGWLFQYNRGCLAFTLAALAGERMGSLAIAGNDFMRTQSRTAFSWITGHVAVQGLTPMVLYLLGASAAGQMGMTLAIAIVPFTIGMSWLQGRFPEYGALASRRENQSLRATARRATIHASVVCLVGSVGVVLLIEALGYFAPWLRARFLEDSAVAALGVAMLAALLLQAMAGYLRAYRAEPLLSAVVSGYAAMLLAAWWAAASYGASAAAIAYAIASCVVALPLTALAFRRVTRALDTSSASVT
jgi:hypothetical protein